LTWLHRPGGRSRVDSVLGPHLQALARDYRWLGPADRDALDRLMSEMFREGVITSLQSFADIVVVGQASNAADVMRIVRDELPDMAIVDVTMPGGGIQRRHTSPLHARRPRLSC
jgi:hypothetical protein